jgi:hypothetical protein
MSRSYKKSPYLNPCKGHNDSDKFDKQLGNAAFRRRTHIALQTGDLDALPIKHTEGRNLYSFHASDGPKRYRANAPDSIMRK